MQMRAIYAECLGKLMEADERIVLLDADLGKASGTLGLRERFPERIYDCGVAEQNMCSIAAGLASYGFTPWIESFTPFATRRICDQIAISVCYAGQNVKIVGTDPGIEVQLRAAMPVLQAYPHPVYLRLVRGEQPNVFGDGYSFDLFRADRLREGSDLTILVSGILTADCLSAAEKLKTDGISCEVINVHTIKPIDRETVLASARRTGAVLTVENHNLVGGLHAAVLEALACERIPVFAVGVEDRFGEVGKLPYLRDALGLTEEHILRAAREAAASK